MGDDGNEADRMSAASLNESDSSFPARLRLLCISATEPSCENLSLQLEELGCVGLSLRWVASAAEALAVLRESSFDCMVIQETPSGADTTCGRDSLTLLQAIRASGCDDPVLIVSAIVTDEMW